ncbi:hypothetical protein [Microbacterium hibisci]|uniref:hypothetical protein n=1 Tax=Microbacterium hibisci TaxID=2036000 RepID=UPI001942723F|nr:hypothetical protein [Microbacterium hibisci]
MRKRTLKALAGALMAAALVVAPLATAGASAAKPDKPESSGSWTNDTNKVEYWEELYKAHKADCYKVEGAKSSDHGTVSPDEKSITLKEFNQSWPGDHWEVLVIKAGSADQTVIEHPQAGVPYASPINNGGQQAEISHWIVCKGENPKTEPVVVTPTLDWTPPSCDVAGELIKGAGAIWTSAPGTNGATIWTAKPAPGYDFPEGIKTIWEVPNLAKLVEGCASQQPEDKVTEEKQSVTDCVNGYVVTTTTTTTTPFKWDADTKTWVLDESKAQTVKDEKKRELTDEEREECYPTTTKTTYGEWADGEWDCGDTTVTQTREVYTTVYRGEVAEPTVTTTEKQTRDLTSDEIGEDCELVPGDITSMCVSDVPYLSYEVTLPEGFEADSETPVTITFVNPDGEDYVRGDQPLSGSLLWPGASDGPTKMWPGWELVDGEYVKTDGNFNWTREGVTVRFAVNPTYETVVEYPAATALCANPPVGGGDDPTDTPTTDTPTTGTPASDDSEALAATGGGVSPMFAVAGGTALLAGIAAVAFAAYRRRQAGTR